MRKVKTIILKEWAEVFKNRRVLLTTAFLPLFFTALPLTILYVGQGAGGMGGLADMPAQFAGMCPAGVSGDECFQVFFVSQFMMLFMMLPMIIPVNIAAYSIVGEKTGRSLEPLLATPITTAELLIGKNLAAAVPAMLATWLGFGIYALGAAFVVRSPAAFAALFDATWLLGVFVVGPLLAVLSVNFSLMVSSRVNDPRVAEQISALVILPVMALFMGQVAGVLFISRSLILVLAVVLAALDVGLVRLTVRLFQRETILTRWK
jgi:ABC-2 type transport system permease protein